MKAKTLSLVAGMTLVANVGFAQELDETAEAGNELAASAQKGMTWTKTGVDDIVGVVDVGCGYTPGVGNQCNPYTGDTVCSAELPVLCFYDAQLDQPEELIISSRYHQWSGGIVATTDAVRGDSFDNVNDVNYFCEENFGYGWRVAEFHDGWGWYFKAYGNVGNKFNESRRRLWVDIDDQPNGTCWTH
jgi:hypothetical protein